MKKTLIDKRIIFKLLFGIVIALLTCIKYISQTKIDGSKFEEFIVYLFGYLNFQNVFDDITGVLFLVFPQFYILLILGNYLEQNLQKQAVFIFTRTSSRVKWLLQGIKKITLYVFIYCTLIILTIWIFGIVFNLNNKSNANLFTLLFSQFLIMFFSYLFLIILTNILSIKYSSTHCIPLIFTCNLFLYFSSIRFIESKIVSSLIPSIHSLLFLHDLKSIVRVEEPLKFYIEGFYICTSIMYYLIFIIAFIILGFIWIRKKDII